MGEKAEVAEAVINRHHHGAARRQRLAVIRRQPARSHHEAAAVQPHHYRQRPRRFDVGGPDVKIEAVFAERTGIAAARDSAERAILPAGGAELGRIAHLVPRRNRLWCAPAQRAYRRGGIWNTLKDKEIIIHTSS